MKLKKLLLVRLDAIGDFVLWLSAAEKFRDAYADYHITLLGNDIWTEMAQSLPYWDLVWPLDRARFWLNPCYRWRLEKTIRDAEFDIAINIAYSRSFFFDDFVVRICGADERIGFSGDLSNIRPWLKSISDRWYTRLVPSISAPLMELHRNFEFFHFLGCNSTVSVAELPVLAKLPPTLCLDEKYFVLFPGASWPGRLWPIEKFVSVAKSVQGQTGWRVVVCGGPGDKRIAAEFARQFSGKSVNFAGKTSLTEFVEVVRNAELVVGNDTSAIHIAAAVKTPSVCLLGGGHYGRFLGPVKNFV